MMSLLSILGGGGRESSFHACQKKKPLIFGIQKWYFLVALQKIIVAYSKFWHVSLIQEENSFNTVFSSCNLLCINNISNNNNNYYYYFLLLVLLGLK